MCVFGEGHVVSGMLATLRLATVSYGLQTSLRLDNPKLHRVVIASKTYALISTVKKYMPTTTLSLRLSIQCFDTVGWATGRASGL